MAEKAKRRSKEDVLKLVEIIKKEVADGTPATVACSKHSLAYQVFVKYAGGGSSKGKGGDALKLVDAAIENLNALKKIIRKDTNELEAVKARIKSAIG